MEVKLEVYTFKVRKTGQTKDYEKIDNFAGIDFIDFVELYINSQDKSLLVNPTIQRSYQMIESELLPDYGSRQVSGIIKSGDYGDETEITTQKGVLKFTKNRYDLTTRPFYFLIKIPEKGTVGYVVLQRTGIYGINGQFQEAFVEFFDTQYPDYKIEFGQFLSKELMREFIANGGIQELRFTKYNVPEDVTDKLNLNNVSEDLRGVKVIFFAKNRRFLEINKFLTNYLNDKNTYFFDVAPLKELGFDKGYDISVKAKKDGKSRIIDLSDTGQIRPYYNIDEDVKKNPTTGHVVFESIDKIAKDLLKDLTKLPKAKK